MPLKLKACPTSPLVKVTPPAKVPLLVPMMSLALPSPGHQLTMPAGGGTQSADHARNAAGKRASPAITHQQVLIKGRSGLTAFAEREGPNKRNDGAVFIVTFRGML